MGRGSYFFVYFEGATTLDDAARLFRERTWIKPVVDGECLVLSSEAGPALVAGLSTEKHVVLEARELADEHGLPELARCHRRFEVHFDDLEAVLDETNTLAETQLRLQELTRGFLFNSWNGSLSRPEPA